MELGFALVLATSIVARAPGVALEWLTDSTVNPPGIQGQFSITRVPPVSCGGSVLFLGATFEDDRLGLYSVSPGGLEVIANSSTPIPGSDKTFQEAWQPACAGDRIVFLGDDDLTPSSTGPSAYVASQSIIEPLLEVGTMIGDNEFTGFGDVSGTDSAVGLRASLVPTSTTEAMVIKPFGDDPFIVADRTTVLPGQTEPATIYSQPVLHGPDLVFHARTQGNLGIYRWSEGEGLSIIADTQTPVPLPDTGNFGIFDQITSLDDGVAFGACYFGGCGIFLWDGADLAPLVVPGDVTRAGKALVAAGYPAGSGSLLSFTARPADEALAIYARTGNGPIKRLLGIQDTIDGYTVNEILSSADDTSVALLFDTVEIPRIELIYQVTFVETVEIPTLSRSGLLAMILGLALAALFLLPRRTGGSGGSGGPQPPRNSDELVVDRPP